MAIAFDAATNGVPAFYFPTCTFAHTCSGADRVLFVSYQGDNGAADLVTGVTYNGVALTHVASFLNNNNRWIGLWYLVNPAAGANNVVITVSANSVLFPIAWSYTGAIAPEANATGTKAGGAGNVTLTVTTLTDQAWVVGAVVSSASGGGLSAGAATTERQDLGDIASYDGNAPVSPAGSSTLTIATTAGLADGICVSLPPAGGGGGGGGQGWPAWW